MIQDVTGNIMIYGSEVEQVDTFTYLGSLITIEAASTKDLKAKLSKAYGLAQSVKILRNSHKIGIKTKTRLLRSLVWPVHLTDVKDRKVLMKIAFEIKAFGQLLRVLWAEKKSNDCVLETRRPASADRTARRQFQATGQPVSRTQPSDAMTSRLPRYEAKCVQRRCFHRGSVPLRSDIKGTELPPCQYIDTPRKAIDCATTLLLTVFV